MKKHSDYKDYLALFIRHGGTDDYYLYVHYPRFQLTQKFFYENWSLDKGKRLLDIGAH